jgi:hypothetical protein
MAMPVSPSWRSCWRTAGGLGSVRPLRSRRVSRQRSSSARVEGRGRSTAPSKPRLVVQRHTRSTGDSGSQVHRYVTEGQRDIFTMPLPAASRALDDWFAYASRSRLAPLREAGPDDPALLLNCPGRCPHDP